MSENFHLFCFGLGYSAKALARSLSGPDWTVCGTCQEKAEGDGQTYSGFDLYPFRREQSLTFGMEELLKATHILVSIPPDSHGDVVLDRHGGDMKNCRNLQWVGYLSSTGVYGDTGGNVVTETAPLNPTSTRSRQRQAAEAEWLDWGNATGVSVQIFRLAGIYGPGRSALDQVRNGMARRIHKPDHLFGRIQVDDIAAVLLASMKKPRNGAVYNVCDNVPATQADVISFACGLLGVEPPPLIPYEEARKTMAPMALSFWQDNRRIDNSLIHEELGVRLQYPDYKSGLNAVMSAERVSPPE